MRSKSYFALSLALVALTTSGCAGERQAASGEFVISSIDGGSSECLPQFIDEVSAGNQIRIYGEATNNFENLEQDELTLALLEENFSLQVYDQEGAKVRSDNVYVFFTENVALGESGKIMIDFYLEPWDSNGNMWAKGGSLSKIEVLKAQNVVLSQDVAINISSICR